MLDCWMAYDADYAVRMCEALRPYRMRWMEEMLMPHDWKPQFRSIYVHYTNHITSL